MREAGVAIIGGGPAGLSAAIVAARLGARVSVLEASARVGGKILATGNGRCNLSNAAVSSAAYNHPEFVAPVLDAFPPEAVLSFFGELGLLTYADEQDRVYPVTNVANSVLDVLRLECEHLGVEQRVGFRAGSVSARADGGFDIHHGERETLRADAVVIATGGADRLLADMGHDSVPHEPVLGPLKTDMGPIRGLSGIRVRCAATLLAAGAPLATERGELLFREYGVSGIMVFDLSRFVRDGCVLSIDFLPDIAAGELREMLAARVGGLSWRDAETFLGGMLHPRLGLAVMRAAGVDLTTPAAELPLDRLTECIKDFRLAVTGHGDASQSQVTRGGAAVTDFDANTMESRRFPGLFAAGEALDVDGRCGGFNLHWAWASGIVAGANAARAAGATGGAGAPGAAGAAT